MYSLHRDGIYPVPTGRFQDGTVLGRDSETLIPSRYKSRPKRFPIGNAKQPVANIYIA